MPRKGSPGRAGNPQGTPIDPVTGTPVDPRTGKPIIPKRKWWQYLPFLGKKYDDELAQYESDVSDWYWERETEYTDPKNQADLWREAGFSPGIMYGQGAGSAGEGAGTPDASASNRGNVTGMKLDRFLDAQQKLAMVKDTNASAKLKGAQATDLLKEIESKDSRWWDENKNDVMDIDPRKLPYRDRIRYQQAAIQMENYVKEYNTAKSSRHQASILGKIDEQKNLMLMIQMFSMLGNTMGRFMP